ncbi:alkylhydroperoxidase [Amycolatopsis antarctica]|uniref:Alkylhydroperoxidase n=1 Tax=Amycolatopsis antarctica TaxID=1854586 RepID=A0A263CX24_9PSEU|nr:carboxymuconolactone decarboxylase family protein [Amycolatopsis antarctica]OZM70682.1 alkylhydroperoxidase [Amycolatopsis antarctica]
MSRLSTLSPADAPDKARALLADIAERHGSVGPMIATMAHSPALLQGYLELSRAMKRLKLPRTLSEKISLAVQEWLGCALCLEAHTTAGRAAGLTDTDITMARQGLSVDDRETALLSFATRVLAEPFTITDDDLTDLRAHGWNDRVIADTVGLVALNQLTGSFNLVAGLEPDES